MSSPFFVPLFKDPSALSKFPTIANILKARDQVYGKVKQNPDVFFQKLTKETKILDAVVGMMFTIDKPERIKNLIRCKLGQLDMGTLYNSSAVLLQYLHYMTGACMLNAIEFISIMFSVRMDVKAIGLSGTFFREVSLDTPRDVVSKLIQLLEANAKIVQNSSDGLSLGVIYHKLCYLKYFHYNCDNLLVILSTISYTFKFIGGECKYLSYLTGIPLTASGETSSNFINMMLPTFVEFGAVLSKDYDQMTYAIIFRYGAYQTLIDKKTVFEQVLANTKEKELMFLTLNLDCQDTLTELIKENIINPSEFCSVISSKFGDIAIADSAKASSIRNICNSICDSAKWQPDKLSSMLDADLIPKIEPAGAFTPTSQTIEFFSLKNILLIANLCERNSKIMKAFVAYSISDIPTFMQVLSKLPSDIAVRMACFAIAISSKFVQPISESITTKTLTNSQIYELVEAIVLFCTIEEAAEFTFSIPPDVIYQLMKDSGKWSEDQQFTFWVMASGTKDFIRVILDNPSVFNTSPVSQLFIREALSAMAPDDSLLPIVAEMPQSHSSILMKIWHPSN